MSLVISAHGRLCCKSRFGAGDKKFCGLQERFSCKDVRGPHRLTLNSQAASVMRLRSHESAIAFRFMFSRKIRGPATFDFCNNIGPKPSFSSRERNVCFEADCVAKVVLRWG